MGALARDISRGGISGGSAQAINGVVATGITAAGTTIGTATDLVATVNVIGTVTTAGDGVQLPSMVISDVTEVYNDGANACTVYPDQTTVAINQLSTGSGILLAPNTGARFRKVTSTQIWAILSA